MKQVISYFMRKIKEDNMEHKNEPAKEIYVFKIKQPDIVSGCSYIILVLKNQI